MEIKEPKNSHSFIYSRKNPTVLCSAHVGFTSPRLSGLQILPQEKKLPRSTDYQDFFFFPEKHTFFAGTHTLKYSTKNSKSSL